MALYCRMSGVDAVSGATSWSTATSGPGAVPASGPTSSIDAADLKGGCHAVDGQHVRSHPVTHTVFLRKTYNIPEAVDHDLVQAAVDQLFVPEKALPILHPFKVG